MWSWGLIFEEWFFFLFFPFFDRSYAWCELVLEIDYFYTQIRSYIRGILLHSDGVWGIAFAYRIQKGSFVIDR